MPNGTTRRVLPWVAWCAVVFGSFNSCEPHRDFKRTSRWLAAGGFPLTLSTGIRALRAAGCDDGDINRYFAYANAVLGRPYQGFFVRPLEGWKVDARSLENGVDPEDPDETPPITPAAPARPYLDFSVEYPPGFFLVALPPALVARGMDGYSIAFSNFMALLLTAAVVLAASARPRGALNTPTPGSLVAWSAGAALALGVIAVRRFDPVVSLSLCLVAWGCATRRPVWAGLGVGLGVATKGMPILIVPVLVAYWLRAGRVRDLLVAAAAAIGLGLVVGLPFAFTAGAHLFDMLAYHGGRPLQVESTGGALLILARAIDPASAIIARTFGSSNVVGRWEALPRAAAGVLPLVSVAGVLAWASWALGRSSDEGARFRVVVRAMCATLASFMVLGKVFSPQYLAWLLPLGVLASLVDGNRRLAAALVTALGLTQIIYPFLYRVGAADALEPWFGAIVLARNLVLLGWAVALLAVESRALPATRTLSNPELP